MIEIERKMRNETKLLEMHPAFRVRLQSVIKELESYGYRPRIEQAWLSQQEQADAYRSGRSGVIYGFHNITSPAGVEEALAADVWDDNDFAHQQTPFMLHLLAAAEANGLTTGMRWELSPEKVEAIDDAIAIKNWDGPIYAGREPLHVEITGLSIQDAKDGKRPPMPGESAPNPANNGGQQILQPASGSNQPKTETKPMRYKVKNLDTGSTSEYTANTAFRPMVFLPVPYVSQLGTGADAHRNDCGAAAAIMLLRAYSNNLQITPNEFYTKFAISGDPYLSVPQLRAALGSLGVQTDFRTNLSVQDLFAFLAAGKPAIVLLRYKVFEEAGLTEKAFDGPHFAVVVGMDVKNIYLHDPLYTNPADGDAHSYPLDLFWKAWKEVATDPNFPNPERAAIIPRTGVGFRLIRKVKVNISSLNVRKEPMPGAKLLGTLKRDQIVEITREMNGWGEIPDVGWISLTYTVAA
jgi:hypothetical protein